MAAVIFSAGKKFPAAARRLMVLTAAAHFALTAWTLVRTPELEWSLHGSIWLKLDQAGGIILFITSLLFLAVSIQTLAIITPTPR